MSNSQIKVAASDLIAAVRRAASQEQFLEVVAPEEARARFAKHIDLSPLPGERVSLQDALGRTLAQDVVAPIDVPPFDRSGVDGFAVRALDTANASDTSPRRLLRPATGARRRHPTRPLPRRRSPRASRSRTPS